MMLLTTGNGILERNTVRIKLFVIDISVRLEYENSSQNVFDVIRCWPDDVTILFFSFSILHCSCHFAFLLGEETQQGTSRLSRFPDCTYVWSKTLSGTGFFWMLVLITRNSCKDLQIA